MPLPAGRPGTWPGCREEATRRSSPHWAIHKRIGAVLGSSALFVGVALTAGAGTAIADETGDLAPDSGLSVSRTGA
ncbi:hypothetical protein PV721_01115 [Streptomyces sp. MB09-01]|uniref:hypothetical protein n=1 Tax=Streptomyces sp. MB09-01 TaxID=3028666 RepID=UPI0029A45A7D|nr:hypothetical protein [Streptomyces sp. MB09-01]MDX3532995.1 hypothetical protein [Streptomyces sp. MB09-01]